MRPLILFITTLLIMTGFDAHAQSSKSSATTSPPTTLIQLTPAELQTEIEKWCANDASQARQFRSQVVLTDRCRQALDESTGSLAAVESALSIASRNATADAAEVARLNEAHKTDGVVSMVSNVFAASAGILMTLAGHCFATGGDPYICGFESAAAGVLVFGVVAFHVWRF